MILEPRKVADYVWLNGEFIKWENATTHLLTHSLHYSGAVFEGIRSYNGKAFLLQEHMDRLLLSAQYMHLVCEYSSNDLCKITQNLLAKNNLPNAYIRPLIFRPAKAMGLASFSGNDHVLIMTIPSDLQFKSAMEINVASWRKPAPNSMHPQAKSSAHYAMSIVIRKEAENSGNFSDSIVLDYEDYITECTTSNIFFGKDQTLFTPIADRFLNGITRQAVIRLASQMGLKVIEKRIKVSYITDFDYAFATGTSCEIQEISAIDAGDRKIAFSKSSMISNLQDAFAKLVGKF